MEGDLILVYDINHGKLNLLFEFSSQHQIAASANTHKGPPLLLLAKKRNILHLRFYSVEQPTRGGCDDDYHIQVQHGSEQTIRLLCGCKKFPLVAILRRQINLI